MAVIAGHQMPAPALIMSGAGVVMLIDNPFLPWYGNDAYGWHPTHTGFESGFLAN